MVGGGIKNMLVAAIAMILTIPSFARGVDSKPILIGATVSLEGKYSEPSFMIQNAFSLWEQEINTRGGLLGRPVKLILYDDKSQEKLVRQLYQKLILEEKVDLVFSPNGTPLTLAASEVSERNRMVMLACAASGEQIWERQYKYVFGVYALAKRYFKGVLGPSQWEPDERIPFPGTKKFIEGFVAYAKKVPSYHADSAYAASQILERAVTQTRSLNHNNIREYIRAMDTVTVIGRFKVNHMGKQIGHNPIMIQWQKGEKEIVYPTKMQTASVRF